MTPVRNLVPMPPVRLRRGAAGLSYLFALCGLGIAK